MVSLLGDKQMIKHRQLEVEIVSDITLTLKGVYSPADPSVGLRAGIDDFQVMMGPIDVTMAISQAEHDALYRVMLDEVGIE